jgi:hypothetical protein
MDKSVSEMRRLVEALKDAKEGTQEYRDIISELNRRYDDYLPKLLDEADGYNEVALAAGKAEQAIRNKARADVVAEGRAAIEKEFGKALGKSFAVNSSTTIVHSVGKVIWWLSNLPQLFRKKKK